MYNGGTTIEVWRLPDKLGAGIVIRDRHEGITGHRLVHTRNDAVMFIAEQLGGGHRESMIEVTQDCKRQLTRIKGLLRSKFGLPFLRETGNGFKVVS